MVSVAVFSWCVFFPSWIPPLDFAVFDGLRLAVVVWLLGSRIGFCKFLLFFVL